jgi:hypothetical protein
MILRAYLDAGYSQKEPRVFYMGGYLARWERWVPFNKKWRAFLRKNNLAFFRMTDYETRQAPYRSWSEERRLAVIKRVTFLIKETADLGVAAAITLPDYEALTPADQRLIGDAYGICASACIAKVARALRNAEVEEPVNYVFELGDKGQGAVSVALNELFADPRRRAKFLVRSISFEGKEDWPGLQIADFMAYETGKHVPRKIGLESRAMRKSLESVLESVPHYGVLFDANQLSKMIANRKKSGG